MSDAAPPAFPFDAPVGSGEALSEQTIERTLADFRDWLHQLSGTAFPGRPDGPGGASHEEPVDLATLVGQFIALRHEVNLQTRASRGQIEQGAKTLDHLAQSLDALRRQQALNEDRGQVEQAESARPMVKALLDAYDSLNLAHREVERIKGHMQRLSEQEAKPIPDITEEHSAGRVKVPVPWILRMLGLGGSVERALSVVQSRWQDAVAADIDRRRAAAREQEKTLERIKNLNDRILQSVQSILTGYGMSLQRLERMLEQQKLTPIPAVGTPFDPERMEAVDVVQDAARPSGEVVEEIRRGYLWHGKVFRFAQVKVARGGAGLAASDASDFNPHTHEE